MPSPDKTEIVISSRHNDSKELAELEAFVAAVEEADLGMFVKSAEYDSVSQCCEITFNMDLQTGEDVAQQLLAIAESTIRQFEWFGQVHHGHGEPDQ